MFFQLRFRESVAQIHLYNHIHNLLVNNCFKAVLSYPLKKWYFYSPRLTYGE
ncbi:hypothetical protein JCM19314_2920 [Nonlabens ulvanivorans]|uniref:Uncharacterized protein n=1 Tax=Nonlabens ulvanivorans TaxID=906888 RepID=A0A090Q721_NONUL|nr:hypothetical protein JCM19314_2920 [Nonlabens ulvanivorans]